jgi:hypothetical protein
MNAAPSPPAREWASHRERDLVGEGVACAHAAAHRRRSAIRRSRRLLLKKLAILPMVVSIGLAGRLLAAALFLFEWMAVRG